MDKMVFVTLGGICVSQTHLVFNKNEYGRDKHCLNINEINTCYHQGFVELGEQVRAESVTLLLLIYYNTQNHQTKISCFFSPMHSSMHMTSG
jgi:hypothetical protein